ncbi:NifB/NifX family molybdenum-iron cluster-binding protein [Nitratiruptor sp. YY09-18]|uniref:NifB/NifX family molybdenum-iron cluster-binding protein n=1 Tax=Nitratiruptor sp. YY09-18 TaxID=2724901 RepID=UPI001916A66E|nr:NifB/NifX family molybdenum-iron cluster-binding protein [Nitratiruptor sp. YY09-18]BCD67278.1 hypothetical protein NitYY0918_C0154 [Nitratiruptor sp. YY09-18]
MVAMPVKTNKEDTAISPLFGHAKYFAFIDENGNVTIEKNPANGGGQVVAWLAQKGVDRVITQHIGRKPYLLLEKAGIACFYPGDGRISIKEALAANLEPINQANIDKFVRHKGRKHG